MIDAILREHGCKTIVEFIDKQIAFAEAKMAELEAKGGYDLKEFKKELDNLKKERQNVGNIK
jgi:hypothetical protein